MAGHGGIEATKARLTNFWWPSLADDVKKYVNSCELCQRRKAERDKPTGDMYSHLVFEPHKQVAIDCLGPITESLTGKKFVMVAIDVFTRFVDAKAVSRIDAPSFAKFLTQYCGRFGIPDTILTDNAPTFVSAMIRELTDSLGVDHIKSTPQHSRGNAVVERLLQTLQEKLSLITSNSNPSLDWEVALPISVLSINTSLHKATGYSPYELTFGIRHPLTSKNIRTKRTPHDLYADMVRLRMESDHANVVALNSEAQARSKSYFDKTHRPRVFKEGDLVLSKTIGRRSKLSNRFESQTFKVLSRTNDIYEIESTSTGIRRHRHTSFLKPFKTRQVTNTQGASMTSTNIVILLLVLQTCQLSSTINFERTAPIVWAETEKYIDEGLGRFLVIVHTTSPCIALNRFTLPQMPPVLIALPMNNVQEISPTEHAINHCTTIYNQEVVAEIDDFAKWFIRYENAKSRNPRSIVEFVAGLFLSNVIDVVKDKIFPATTSDIEDKERVAHDKLTKMIQELNITQLTLEATSQSLHAVSEMVKQTNERLNVIAHATPELALVSGYLVTNVNI